jgi:hypothetical protein
MIMKSSFVVAFIGVFILVAQPLTGLILGQQGDGNLWISYTDSSFTIESVSPYGNFSFLFEWENTGTYIEYNDTSREIRELKRMVFTDKVMGYAIEYWVPIMLYEYVDGNGNGILDDNINIEPDSLVSGYKIVTNIDMTNITVIEGQDGEKICEWTFTQIALPMKSNIQPPWEIFPVVTETFHYYPMVGLLKMDINVRNFKSENALSRLYLSYGVRFTSSEKENSTTTVAFDGQEIPYNEINQSYPTNSTLIKFKVNDVVKAFFDFGGNVTIDDESNIQISGSVGPTRSTYYYQTGGLWLEIGLNYPHVNQTLTHDPYLGLSRNDNTIPEFPQTQILALFALTALIATALLKMKRKLSFRCFPKFSVSHR